MSASRRHSIAEVENVLRFHPPDLVDLVIEIRNIALSVNPSAAERLHSRGLTLYDAEKGGTIKGGICFVDIIHDHVRVRFGLGALLDDPKGLLAGDQQYMRYLDIYSYDEAPWEDIEALIRASDDQDPKQIYG